MPRDRTGEFQDLDAGVGLAHLILEVGGVGGELDKLLPLRNRFPAVHHFVRQGAIVIASRNCGSCSVAWPKAVAASLNLP